MNETQLKDQNKDIPLTAQIVSFNTWLNSNIPLIDLREVDDFKNRRIVFQNEIGLETKYQTIVNLPLGSLLDGERSLELPPRNIAFAVLLPNKSFSNNKLDGKGPAIKSTRDDAESIHSRTISFFFATKSKVTQQSRQSWNIQQILIESPKLWSDALERKMVIYSMHESRIEMPLPRLWQPDPLVFSELKPWLCDMLFRRFQSINNGHRIDSNETIHEIWDLGCGAGRDICFLAEETFSFFCKNHFFQQNKSELTHSNSKKDSDAASTSTCSAKNQSNLNDVGWLNFVDSFPLKFIGIDNHKGSAKRSTPFWKRRGVSMITESKLLNLKKCCILDEVLTVGGFTSFSHSRKMESNFQVDEIEKSNFESCRRKTECSNNLKKSKVVLIYSIRYINRDLLKYIVKEAPLCSGTLVAISHFCKEYENSEWKFDHPKVKNVLERNELENLFVQNGEGRWKLLKNEICGDGDHGRTLIQFLAQRR